MDPVPITQIPPDSPVEIRRLEACGALRNRLQTLGLCVGDRVEVLQNRRGWMILAKGHVRLSINRGLGHKILVVPAAAENKAAKE